MTVSINIKQLAKLVNGEIIGNPDKEIRILSTDSRSLPQTDGVMFIAIKGERHDGHRYIKELYQKGVRTFLVDSRPHASMYPEAVFCLVNNSLDALQEVAIARRREFRGTVIGITGSNGKTIIKEWLYQLLQANHKIIRSPRSYNSQLGVPLSIWPLSNNYDIAILEAGISQPGEMEKLERMILPDIGILSNIGSAHRENFQSDSEKLREKLKLFSRSSKIIYRSDLLVDGVKAGEFLSDSKAELIGWSFGENSEYSFVLDPNFSENNILKLSRGSRELQFKIPFSDDASLENICHVIICLLETGMDPISIRNSIRELEPVEMRLQILKGIHGTTLVNDVYNSDLAGLGSALDVLMQQKNHEKRAVILSDLFQSGLNEEELYSEVSNLLRFKKIDKFYGVGSSMMKFAGIFPQGSEFFPDTASLLTGFNPADISNFALLIKGSRSFQFEKITNELQLQVHQTILEIDVNALVDNLNYYRSIVGSETKIMVMVKALSYGSGSYEIAGLLQHQQVDYLAVAFSDEGIKLRNSGVKLPVMVMSAAVPDFQQLIDHNLEPVIFSSEGLVKFIEICKFNGEENYPIHLKLDTGMHRLGFSEDELTGVLTMIDSKEIKVTSIFSHLAGSDDEQYDEFSLEQADGFIRMSDRIIKKLGYTVIRHLLNSAGAERFPGLRFDMVRIGIGLYGLGISNSLKPVSTFKTIISQTRNLKKGETVGYSRSGILRRDSKIAVLPVGYADGIDRRLGNGNMSFYVNGKPAPTVGNICMDMTMIDITSTDATVGDVVELFGKEIPVSVIAEKLQTISYEVLTSIPERVKRVYIRE